MKSVRRRIVIWTMMILLFAGLAALLLALSGCHDARVGGVILGAGAVDTEAEFVGQRTRVRGIMPFGGVLILFDGDKK